MEKKRKVLITGVSGFWGYKVAAKLVKNPALHVIGIDQTFPDEELPELDFIQTDIRNPLLIELLRTEQIDTVCHLVFDESIRPSESSFETNVMGTIKMCGACAEAGVKKIVLKSSTSVYGARATNSGFLSEENPLRGSRRYGYNRDMVEIEAFCNGFRRQQPQIMLTVLRFPGIVGPKADTPLTRFLSDPLAPVLLGFDPMLQVIHEDDVVDALVHSILQDVPGVYNVAAEGILPLLKVMRLAGKTPIPVVHLFAYWGLDLAGTAASLHMPIEPDYLRFRWIADLSRMRADFNFVPRYTAEEALREFAGFQRTRPFKPEAVALAYDEERLRDTIERRKRAREAMVEAEPVSAKRAKGKKS